MSEIKDMVKRDLKEAYSVYESYNENFSGSFSKVKDAIEEAEASIEYGDDGEYMLVCKMIPVCLIERQASTKRTDLVSEETI